MSGPIRGARDVEGKLFVVSGNTLYQISNAGVAIPLGTIPGTGMVSMSHNQITGGNELVVVNGSAGYVYNTKTAVFERITDPGYPGAVVVDYLDSYMLQVEPFGRFWFHSDLAAAKDYNTLDRYESEAEPDAIVTLAVSNFEVVVFNKTTTEFFGNSGAATGTFQSKRVMIGTGCAGRHTVAKLDNSLFWLGNDGVIYRLDGYQAVPISTPPIEQAIAGCKWERAIASTYESEGHKVYYLTFPDGKTWGYDVTTRMWHRRASFGLDRWRINTLTYWNRKWIAGDAKTGKLYTVDWDYMLEGDEPLVAERTSGVLHGDQNRIGIPYVELVFDTGHGETSAAEFPVQPNAPTITGNAPDGEPGEAYAGFAYTITGGTAPYVVTLVDGVLPPDLTITDQGVIGTEVTDTGGDYPFTLRVTDASGLWDELDDAINVATFVGATFSPTNKTGQMTLSSGNMIATSTAADMTPRDNAWVSVSVSKPLVGSKRIALEVNANLIVEAPYFHVGIASDEWPFFQAVWEDYSAVLPFQVYRSSGEAMGNTAFTDGPHPFVAGDVIGLVLAQGATEGFVEFYLNGVKLEPTMSLGVTPKDLLPFFGSLYSNDVAELVTNPLDMTHWANYAADEGWAV